MAKDAVERYKLAKTLHEQDDVRLYTDAMFGAGVLFGAGCPGAAAALITLAERQLPGFEFPEFR